MKAPQVLVIGGGHAGCEAALASARLGSRTLLITGRFDTVGALSCNPSIGGIGKSHLVAEVDALGGLIGWGADQAGIQFRVLNRRKGPAVRALRAQVDRGRYARVVQQALREQPGLEIHEAAVGRLLLRGGRVVGIRTEQGERVRGEAVVLCPGTFLRGVIHHGLDNHPGGRRGEAPSQALADHLIELGLPMGRLKTGTPARLDGATVDESVLQRQPGDPDAPGFSRRSRGVRSSPVDCFLARTNQETHRIIRAALDRSPLYTGRIVGIGPRYCPSIEDKVVRFPDRSSHQVFLEPEEEGSSVLYAGGLSTSLPREVQQRFLRSIQGLEQVEMIWPGYGIEYDFVDPRGLDRSLRWKAIQGLYLAGQINGTSGYEEAAAQGLLAGANAALESQGRGSIRLGRDQAYLGVMVDDLVSRGVVEPYRMFTSRAEYRIRLRAETAERRLIRIGRGVGLVGAEQFEAFLDREERAEAEERRLARARIRPGEETDRILAEAGIQPLSRTVSALELLRRPGVDRALLERLVPGGDADAGLLVEGAVHYRGFLEREEALARRCRAGRDLPFPEELTLEKIRGLRPELVERLREARPATLGDAADLPGMTPAALALLEGAIRRGCLQGEDP